MIPIRARYEFTRMFKIEVIILQYTVPILLCRVYDSSNHEA